MEPIIIEVNKNKKQRTDAQIRASKKFYLLNRERLNVYYKEKYHNNLNDEEIQNKNRTKRKEKYSLIKELLQQHKQNIIIYPEVKINTITDAH